MPRVQSSWYRSTSTQSKSLVSSSTEKPRAFGRPPRVSSSSSKSSSSKSSSRRLFARRAPFQSTKKTKSSLRVRSKTVATCTNGIAPYIYVTSSCVVSWKRKDDFDARKKKKNSVVFFFFFFVFFFFFSRLFRWFQASSSLTHTTTKGVKVGGFFVCPIFQFDCLFTLVYHTISTPEKRGLSTKESRETL